MGRYLPKVGHGALMQSHTWLKDTLLNELEAYSLKRQDICKLDISGESVFRKSLFQKECQTTFMEHRDLYLHKQLNQYASLFLKTGMFIDL